MGRGVRLSVIALCAALMCAGCAARYFHDVSEPQQAMPSYTLDTLPFSDYWTGITFKGKKIGFTHFHLSPSKTEKDCFEIRTKASLHFRFLMMEKNLSFNAYDLVDKDLHLIRFSCVYEVDGSRLKLSGASGGDVLKVVKESGGKSFEEETRLTGELYPGSAMYLYPLLKGMKTGDVFRYMIFDTETQGITEVSQEVLAYQMSGKFEGTAFKMKTRYQGQETSTWINAQGLPLYETAMNGVIVSCLVDERRAGQYLEEAGEGRDEPLLEFSLVKVGTPIPDPSSKSFLKVSIRGVPPELVIPTDGRQVCERRGDLVMCSISSAGSSGGTGPQDEAACLKPSCTVPSDADEILKLAARITKGITPQAEQVRAILEWIRSNIEQAPVDVFTAMDVLEKKKAECQGHAYLYAALARSVRIPTRVANGLVYSEDFGGFLYHAWAESLVDGRWVAVDPTMNRMPADATHIKLGTGEDFSSMVPLQNLMGRIAIEVLDAR